jgi:UDP-GlcNAc:undecaprenyl-phosphate GlcNAc-1-phosphate transferase
MLTYILAFVLLLCVSAALVFVTLLRRFFSSRKLLLSREGIPLAGGIGMGAIFICAALIYCARASFPLEAAGLIAASFIMLCAGVVDDWRELSIGGKFLTQFVAATVLVLCGIKTDIVSIGLAGNLVITYIWVLGITNAINHLDILDGAAAGIVVMAAGALCILSALTHNTHAFFFCALLCAVSLGFLVVNLPPAKVYMGNAGSHFLGFVLAAVALSISYAPLERSVALASPLLILGFPMLDTWFLVWMRFRKRLLPFKKSNDHLILRLLAKGYSKKRTLAATYLLGAFFVLCGLAVSRVPNGVGLGIIGIALLLGAAVMSWMSKVPCE